MFKLFPFWLVKLDRSWRLSTVDCKDLYVSVEQRLLISWRLSISFALWLLRHYQDEKSVNHRLASHFHFFCPVLPPSAATNLISGAMCGSVLCNSQEFQAVHLLFCLPYVPKQCIISELSSQDFFFSHPCCFFLFFVFHLLLSVSLHPYCHGLIGAHDWLR